jgi:hypothetical protein
MIEQRQLNPIWVTESGPLYGDTSNLAKWSEQDITQIEDQLQQRIDELQFFAKGLGT